MAKNVNQVLIHESYKLLCMFDSNSTRFNHRILKPAYALKLRQTCRSVWYLFYWKPICFTNIYMTAQQQLLSFPPLTFCLHLF